MYDHLLRVKSRILPPLDPDFCPAYLGNKAFAEGVRGNGQAAPLCFALERPHDRVSVYRTVAFPPGHAMEPHNLAYAERILKFLLWQKGSARVFVWGPPAVAEYLRGAYAPGGARAFDSEFMG